jgi:hypothetical protein
VAAMRADEFLEKGDTRHLTGHFNAHLKDALIVFADEAFTY